MSSSFSTLLTCCVTRNLPSSSCPCRGSRKPCRCPAPLWLPVGSLSVSTTSPTLRTPWKGWDFIEWHIHNYVLSLHFIRMVHNDFCGFCWYILPLTQKIISPMNYWSNSFLIIPTNIIHKIISTQTLKKSKNYKSWSTWFIMIP